MNDDFVTLVDILRWRALHQPEQRAYTFLRDGMTEEASFTYAELDRQARSIGALLQNMGATGKCALLLYPQGLEYIATLFGCFFAGTVAVPAYPPSSNRSLYRIQAIAANAQATIILTTSQILSNLQRWLTRVPDLEALQWVATDNELENRENRWQEPRLAGDKLAFLQYTSGSTGNPKGVMVSHNNLMHNSAMIRERCGHTPESVNVSWLPIFHDLGLVAGVLQPLYVGFPAILMTPAAFLQRPIRWLHAISKYRGTSSYAPNFAYELCIHRFIGEERAEFDLSTWSVALNGAEPVRPETIHRFVETFGAFGFRRETFAPAYGLAEGTLAVSWSSKGTQPVMMAFDKVQLEQNRVVDTAEEGETARILAGSGSPISGQQVAIVNPISMAKCQPDEVGEIWVAGPSIAQGYWRRPEVTEQTFHARLADTGEGPFLRTGDLGFLRDGELFIVGRLKDLLVIRGRNLYPQDIELTVEQSHEALQPAGGAAFSVEVANEERLVVIQEVRRDYKNLNGSIEAVRRAIAEEHEVQAYAVVLIKTRSLPKTSSGKIQRKACRAEFLAGELKVVESSILEEWSFVQTPNALTLETLLTVESEERRQLLETYLLEHASRVLKVRPSRLNPYVCLSAFGLDSLMAIELQNRIETDLGVNLLFVDFLQSFGIAELATKILDRLSEANASPALHLLIQEQEAYKEYPLSFIQEQIWFLTQLAPNSSFYTVPFAIHIRGELHLAALEQSYIEVLRRHEALQTRYVLAKGYPAQQVTTVLPVQFMILNLANLSATERETEAQRLLTAAAQQSFSLKEGSLLRLHLLHLRDREHILLLTLHHIICDGWSLQLLLHDLFSLYQSYQQGRPSLLAPLPVRYADYALWQRQQLTEDELRPLLRYWQAQLANLNTLELPTDHPRLPVESHRGAIHRFELSANLLEPLKELSKQERVTLFMTLLAAFQALLARYSGQEEIVVGIPSANRTHAEVEGVVGCFINMLVIRTNLADAPSFREVLKRVRKVCLEAYAHQNLPFEHLVKALQSERNLSHNPLYQVLFSWQPSPLETVQLPDLTLDLVSIDRGASKMDLSLELMEGKQEITAVFEYNTDLFEAATIERMAAHYQNLLSALVANPEQRVADLPLLSIRERQQLLVDWNATQRDYSQDRTLPELFESQVGCTPDAIAVVFEAQQLTYHELNRRANQLAHYLQTQGVGPEVRVGICMERSLELVIGLLGILKAGGAYVPLDPTYPTERLNFMVTDAQIAVIVTQQEFLEKLPVRDMRLVCLDRDGHLLEQEPTTNPMSGVLPENLAYVIYTSGSTGAPKGAAISHASWNNLLSWFICDFHLTPHDTSVIVTSQSFDLTQKDLFAPLLVGGKVSLLASGYDTFIIQQTLREQGITLLNCTPSMFYPLIETPEQLPFPDLRWVFLGGEPIVLARIADWVQSPLAQARIVNTYGPTECTDVVVFYPLEVLDQDRTTSIPLGRPIPNTEIYLLDQQLHLVPIGVPGELYIGGDGLARGYLNRPDLTAERFIPHPFKGEGGSRLYRTGDLARYLPDGTIEFVGRADQQVKIRGFRVEPGEVEAALRAHQAVLQGIVLAREDVEGDKRLVAYLVARSGQQASTSELRNYLQTYLPTYMLPAAFVWLETLPLTPNGKVDRRALPAPHLGAGEESFVAPRTPTEDILSGIWTQVLGIERISIHDDFFKLGGHSLLATQVIARVCSIFRVELSLQSFLEAPTIVGLATVVTSNIEEQKRNFVSSIKKIANLCPEEEEQLIADLHQLSAEEFHSLLIEVQQDSAE